MIHRQESEMIAQDLRNQANNQANKRQANAQTQSAPKSAKHRKAAKTSTK